MPSILGGHYLISGGGGGGGGSGIFVADKLFSSTRLGGALKISNFISYLCRTVLEIYIFFMQSARCCPIILFLYTHGISHFAGNPADYESIIKFVEECEHVCIKKTQKQYEQVR